MCSFICSNVCGVNGWTEYSIELIQKNKIICEIWTESNKKDVL